MEVPTRLSSLYLQGASAGEGTSLLEKGDLGWAGQTWPGATLPAASFLPWGLYRYFR